MELNPNKIAEMNAMIQKMREDSIKNAPAPGPTGPMAPAGHSVGDEDISKVASAEVIGKGGIDPLHVLKK